MVKCGPASSAVHLIWGNSKTEDRSPAMVVNTTLVVSTTLRHQKFDNHLLTSEVSDKRSKPALNGAFGLSGFFSPKGVVLLYFFLGDADQNFASRLVFQSSCTVTICFLVKWHWY